MHVLLKMILNIHHENRKEQPLFPNCNSVILPKMTQIEIRYHGKLNIQIR
jgi:hypothetical protein